MDLNLQSTEDESKHRNRSILNNLQNLESRLDNILHEKNSTLMELKVCKINMNFTKFYESNALFIQ